MHILRLRSNITAYMFINIGRLFEKHESMDRMIPIYSTKTLIAMGIQLKLNHLKVSSKCIEKHKILTCVFASSTNE